MPEQLYVIMFQEVEQQYRPPLPTPSTPRIAMDSPLQAPHASQSSVAILCPFHRYSGKARLRGVLTS